MMFIGKILFESYQFSPLQHLLRKSAMVLGLTMIIGPEKLWPKNFSAALNARAVFLSFSLDFAILPVRRLAAWVLLLSSNLSLILDPSTDSHMSHVFGGFFNPPVVPLDAVWVNNSRRSRFIEFNRGYASVCHSQELLTLMYACGCDGWWFIRRLWTCLYDG